MNKYKLYGKIYVVKSPNIEKIYIGSTCQRYLADRMVKHRAKETSITSAEIIDAGDAYIELLENYPCESKEELLWRERFWIETLQKLKTPIANKVRPTRTLEEKKEAQRIISSKPEHVEKRKEYAKTHREQKRAQQNSKHMCECGIQYTQANKNRHIATPAHQKFLETGEINIEKVVNRCECGGKYTDQHRTTHAKSQKHQKYLESLK